MKVLFSLIAALGLLQAAIALLVHIPPLTVGIDAGICKYRDEILKPGLQYFSNCEAANCNDDGSITVQTCADKDVPVGCKLDAQLHPYENYPTCCIYSVHCEDGREYVTDFINN